MISTNRAIIVGSPEDSDGFDDTDLEARGTSYSSLSREGSQRYSGQSDEGSYIKEEEPGVENYQVSSTFVPCINTMGSGCTDPFQTLPNLAGGDTELLTHHCAY